MNNVYMRESYNLKDKFVVVMYYAFSGTWRYSQAMDKEQAEELVKELKNIRRGYKCLTS